MAGNELNIQIPQNLDPVYSNMIQIAFKDDEFTMMFLHQLPMANQAKAKAIVAISPTHAKKLLAALDKSVKDYEAKFGQITGGAHADGSDTATLQGYS
ncbi:hypothetical protein Mlab_0382 [Methanocorpusculum labreanum Z]|uniref:DUF3467 domain-containing protein n=1 Tax=Methanocorpusculum labreanum (strain ATCC 43576 / DSM 4855 / Z) TaxID=410358 RepID=A2SQF2_METLZ|nr:DUF3467 domain-containing protein [Methanocorpusculum labreanum]ABN06558.1 hypothetical protein Mlab_0382 [Methanocorpusculum labreanum Z]